MSTNGREKRAPRARRATRTHPRPIELRLSKEQRAFLDYLVDLDKTSSPAAWIRESLDSFMESDEDQCLDPTKSKFRAWKLEREGRTSRITCGWDGDVPRFCRACTARFGDVLTEIAAARRRRTRRTA